MTRKRTREIKIRMDEIEYAAYQKQLEKSAMSGNDYGIKCLLNHKINVIENMPELIRQLKAIGNNLNQIARAANNGQPVPPTTEIQEGVKELWQWLKRAKGADR